jgi:hypothetical protein
MRDGARGLLLSLSAAVLTSTLISVMFALMLRPTDASALEQELASWSDTQIDEMCEVVSQGGRWEAISALIVLDPSVTVGQAADQVSYYCDPWIP